MPKKGPKGKKGKAAAAVDESVEVAPEPEPASEEPWTCLECEQENEFTDEACIACDEPRPKAAEPEAVDPYAGFKVGTRWINPTCSPYATPQRLACSAPSLATAAPRCRWLWHWI